MRIMHLSNKLDIITEIIQNYLFSSTEFDRNFDTNDCKIKEFNQSYRTITKFQRKKSILFCCHSTSKWILTELHTLLQFFFLAFYLIHKRTFDGTENMALSRRCEYPLCRNVVRFTPRHQKNYLSDRSLYLSIFFSLPAVSNLFWSLFHLSWHRIHSLGVAVYGWITFSVIASKISFQK